LGIRKEFLYIGDSSDDTVKRFNAFTGQENDPFVTSGSGGLRGPAGIIFDRMGNLLVSNQNINLPLNGEILMYDGKQGTFIQKVVSSDQEGAPFAPRGIVLSDKNILYVADRESPNPPDTPILPGELRAYNYNGDTADFIGTFNHSGFDGRFFPRGVVIGPDGLLYVSVVNPGVRSDGWVLRFDPETMNFIDQFVKSDGSNPRFPEGLVFGPDGNLYVTSFRVDQFDENDIDSIFIFDGQSGDFLDKIDLDMAGGPRAFAQALLFGPDGKLFVPISGGGPDAGSVRIYDVQSKTFDVFIPAGGPLGFPEFLTFGKTNPGTLAYEE
jgi:DNA-binding beta-propeller fold protein YncE